uniref:Uncharacterized protein n=1 Tax=Tetraselmis sp. GSL018 TaxID=582737 RepID=A0A061QTQ0_9CHLO|mmetsp:Transcript_178/g.362  ORF Transcript_178/g.362 Transcript_178/m.362 type:complete len:323 (+) Transcript_178:266-1234(+)|eukprot:CAMPEP_0177609600 /NCGR_PEP_ID=MMETSP0419_2-20121207/19195_1 /TAXON_ID=582737 /ORGANISM="Tetraselmis sp., Strain GSL018" /LENGTH=322 /DNA_ID=CAMNT_0019104575 /DNA_START=257 /DNA_END=1225 /DNA_ORIENTATION=+
MVGENDCSTTGNISAVETGVTVSEAFPVAAFKESDGKTSGGKVRTKLCPLCSQTYGTKMGGKPGGTQCTNMVPARDDEGNVRFDSSGKPVLIQCPYVFMSSKQSLVLKRKSEGFAAAKAKVPCPQKLRKLHQLEQVFYGETLNKVEKQLPKLGGEVYVGLVAPTCTPIVEENETRTAASAETDDGQDRLSAVILHHFTGPYLKSVVGDEEKQEKQRIILQQIAHQLAEEKAKTGDEANGAGNRKLLSTNLEAFMSSIKLGHCTERIEQAGLSLPELVSHAKLEKEKGGKPESVARMLTQRAGIPIGAACKIMIAIIQALEKK